MINVNLASRVRKPNLKLSSTNNLDFNKKLSIIVFLYLILPILLILPLTLLIVLYLLISTEILVESFIAVVFSIKVSRATI